VVLYDSDGNAIPNTGQPTPAEVAKDNLEAIDQIRSEQAQQKLNEEPKK